ncbi:hypothetical protein CDEST_07756 [Colletotrichum destructivum]|uniref:Uncharacterized protein n=1 Tax=Colletotrichum destructivum TaxID=34406 RepID=A0AAX4IHH9_9PEZI|nr:hypothetical protein CDEST_07756 [Colletotrichum destructivum]
MFQKSRQSSSPPSRVDIRRWPRKPPHGASPNPRRGCPMSRSLEDGLLGLGRVSVSPCCRRRRRRRRLEHLTPFKRTVDQPHI